MKKTVRTYVLLLALNRYTLSSILSFACFPPSTSQLTPRLCTLTKQIHPHLLLCYPFFYIFHSFNPFSYLLVSVPQARRKQDQRRKQMVTKKNQMTKLVKSQMERMEKKIQTVTVIVMMTKRRRKRKALTVTMTQTKRQHPRNPHLPLLKLSQHPLLLPLHLLKHLLKNLLESLSGPVSQG